jgi:hypothetical protein
VEVVEEAVRCLSAVEEEEAAEDRHWLLVEVVEVEVRCSPAVEEEQEDGC